MGFLDKIKSFFATDEQLLSSVTNSVQLSEKQPADIKADISTEGEINSETVLQELIAFGTEAGYITGKREQESNDVLLSSIKNQVVKMHEEILNYYRRKNLSPDDKLLNRLTMENMFYLAMGTSILVKVKMTNLIAQGYFAKLLKKSGPEFFYREVASMAGNEYGAENVEKLHQHVQRAVYMLLTSIDTRPDARSLVIECAKAMYMYGLAVTIKKKK